MQIITNQKINTIIGILEDERLKKQEIIVDTIIDYEYSEENYINYVDVISLIENHIKSNKFGLLEEALKSLSDMLVDEFRSIKDLTITITKPNIIKDAVVSVRILTHNEDHLGSNHYFEI